MIQAGATAPDVRREIAALGHTVTDKAIYGHKDQHLPPGPSLAVKEAVYVAEEGLTLDQAHQRLKHVVLAQIDRLDAMAKKSVSSRNERLLSEAAERCHRLLKDLKDETPTETVSFSLNIGRVNLQDEADND